MNRDRFVNTALGLLVLCALLTTGLVVRREFLIASAAGKGTERARVAEWREYARSGQRMGPPDAPVTLVMFSDFQCPACAVAAGRLRALREAYPNDVTVLYRHYPLPYHPHAIAAARASECAAAQGRFEAFHDALFARQDSIGRIPWTRFAEAAGVSDSLAFRSCAGASGPVPALERDTIAGRRVEVSVTPTLLLNDLRIDGAVPLDTLLALVNRARTR